MQIADNTSPSLNAESVFVKIRENTIHLRRFYRNADGPGVFLLHGSMEDSKIFYSKSNRGLAPFLARQGYDVYAIDLRGRGLSTPAISRSSDFGLFEAITEDIPESLERIKEIKGQYPEHWMAHSWGGVLLMAALARFEYLHPKTQVLFSSKRNIWVKNPMRYLQIDLIWKGLFALLIKIYGYLPHHPRFFGSSDESAGFHRDTTDWVNAVRWIDSRDGFDYDEACSNIAFPPSLYLTGANDQVLGHPEDVLRFKEQVKNPPDKFVLLSKQAGFMHDYDHINIMTHKDAEEDHFQLVLNWIRELDR